MNKQVLKAGKGAPSRSMGPHVRQVVPTAVADVDPFVFLDHFGPMQRKADSKGVPPHPHAGIATITYLLEGSNRHRDSLGNDATIYPGDLAWMQAGKGIIHAEGLESETVGDTIHGLQFWISLPAKDKFAEPNFNAYRSDTLPETTITNAKMKVLAGSFGDVVSPVVSLSPAYMYDIQVLEAGEINLPITEGYTAALYVVEGYATVEGTEHGTGSLIRFTNLGDAVQFKSLKGSRLMLFGGQPLNEPIYAYASFVMNSRQQIQQVIQDFEDGKFGTLTI